MLSVYRRIAIASSRALANRNLHAHRVSTCCAMHVGRLTMARIPCAACTRETGLSSCRQRNHLTATWVRYNLYTWIHAYVRSAARVWPVASMRQAPALWVRTMVLRFTSKQPIWETRQLHSPQVSQHHPSTEQGDSARVQHICSERVLKCASHMLRTHTANHPTDISMLNVCDTLTQTTSAHAGCLHRACPQQHSSAHNVRRACQASPQSIQR